MKRNSSRRIYLYDSTKYRGFRNFVLRNIDELFKYRFAIFNFINSSLRARYRRSTIGFLWTLLNPLFTMSIMAVVFSTIYKLPFADFGLYLFSGMLPWSLISMGINGGSMSIVHAEGYLKKVYVPKLVFPLATVGVETANFCFSLASLFVLALILGAKVSWYLLLLPLALLLTAFFILGLILILCIITVFLRDLSHIVQIVLMGIFYLTPIIYKMNILPEQFQFYLKLNPIYYFITLFHQIIYQAISPDPILWVICGGLAVAFFFLGLFIFYLKERDIIYRL